MTEQTIESATQTNTAISGRTDTGLERLSILVACALELALFAAGMAGVVSASLLLGVHLAVVAGLVLVSRAAIGAGTDGGVALLAVLATLATGPFGAFGALILPALAQRNSDTEARLAGWYRRIALSGEQDNFTQLSDRIAIGRAANLSAPPPQAFIELFRSGPLAGQQTALGVIARAFHPGYLPVLKIALESPEPLIRVQAAAVAARIRVQLNAKVGELIASASDAAMSAADAAAVAADLTSSIASGLLEENVRLDATRIRDGLQARTMARSDARARAASAGQTLPPERHSAQALDAYAARLLADGRFADFRASRFSQRRPLHGRYRQRLAHARPVDARLALAPLVVRR